MDIGDTMKRNIVKMNDGSNYLSLGNLFYVIKKHSINKNNAMQLELFSIIFNTNDISSSSVNNYCIGLRAIAYEYKKVFYDFKVKNNINLFLDKVIDIINILEDNIYVVDDKYSFINNNKYFYKVTKDLYDIACNDNNIDEYLKEEFKCLFDSNKYYELFIKMLCYVILENKQPLIKNDIKVILDDDLKEFANINLFEGFNQVSSLKRLANKGNIYAAVELGSMEFHKAKKESNNYQICFDYYFKAAVKDHPKACFMVAYLMFKNYVNMDTHLFEKFLNKAIELGSIPAINLLGQVYLLGTNNHLKDLDKAKMCFKEAADLGYAYAFNNLAMLAEDDKKYLKYLKLSGDLGESWALNRLGEYYRNKSSLELAFYYYNLSINSPSYERCYFGYYNLAKYFYLNGVEELGVKRDLNLVRKYADIAYNNGICEAKELLNIE